MSSLLMRPHVRVYGWRDDRLVFVQETPTPSDHPYFLVLDANTALAENRPDKALALVMDVVTHPDRYMNSEWGRYDAATQARIVTYAAVLAMLIHARRHEPGAMQVLLREVEAHYDRPDNPYTRAARLLWQIFQATQDPVAACQAMARSLRQHGAPGLWSVPGIRPVEVLSSERLCPLSVLSTHR